MSVTDVVQRIRGGLSNGREPFRIRLRLAKRQVGMPGRVSSERFHRQELLGHDAQSGSNHTNGRFLRIHLNEKNSQAISQLKDEIELTNRSKSPLEICS